MLLAPEDLLVGAQSGEGVPLASMATRSLVGTDEYIAPEMIHASNFGRDTLAAGIAAHLSYLRLLKPFPCERASLLVGRAVAGHEGAVRA